MIVTWFIDLVAACRQDSLLRNLDNAQQRFDQLHPDIKQFYNWDKVRDSMKYQGALFSVKTIKIVYMCVYDVLFQWFLIPLYIWNYLQVLATRLGLCNQPGGPYYELAFVPLFFVIIVSVDTFIFIGFNWI
jgi:hypothetical protein